VFRWGGDQAIQANAAAAIAGLQAGTGIPAQ
jgi:hypothetical protein